MLYLLLVAAIGIAAALYHMSQREKEDLAVVLRKEGKLGVWMPTDVPSHGLIDVFHRVDFGLSSARGIPEKIRPHGGGQEIAFSSLSPDTQQVLRGQCDIWANERLQLIKKLNGDA
jgi:hypothetical protein